MPPTSSLARATLSETPADAAAPPHRLAAVVILSGTFMVVLDFFIVNVALAAIQHDLGAGEAALQWVVIGYGLANAAVLITGGRLGDVHGRRRVFLLGMLSFTLTSAACGLATGAATLIAARVLQGMSGALLQPQVLALLGELYRGPRRSRAFAAYGLTLGLGAVSGQLIGGLLMHVDIAGLGWRSCFLINVPIGLAALAAGLRVLPRGEQTAGSRLDLAGAALAALTLASVLGPLALGREEGWPLWSLAWLAASLPLAGLFVGQQGRAARRPGGQPLVAPALRGNRVFLLGLAVTLLFYAGNASFYFVLALYLQQGLGLSPLASGGVFAVLAAGFVAASLRAPAFAHRLGPQAIYVGALVLAAGHAMLYLALGPLHMGPSAALLPLLVLQGVGLGMVMAPLVSSILAGLPPAHAGVASGVLTSTQQVGNAAGVALVGLVFFQGRAGGTAASGFTTSLLYLLALALAVAWLYRRLARAADRLAVRP
ncbi:MAG TPA: MFS transporter [Burkholderiaceae bacterium]|nr:MFS transporter [Burkholderiaceae bacterium]